MTTPSLLLGWVIASAVVLAAGVVATVGTGTPYVALLAPAVAAAGIAYAYGPGIDPAWELSRSMAVSDRMVLLVRALAVFGLNAVLGLAASAASGAAAAVTFGWLVPMTAVCALALAAATLARSANVGVAAGLAGWAITVLGGAGRRRQLDRRGHQLLAGPALPAGRGGVRRHRLVRDPDPERNVMNVEISDLTRRFGRTQAVAGVSLETGAGVFGLLGPNGAGKTSLLRMMATVIPPTSGTMRLLGRDPGHYGPRREIRRRLGYLPQNLGYYPGFTVAEFVEYFALLKEMPPGQVPRAVAAAVERVGLGDKARAKLRTLSGGMLRRVGHRPGDRERAGTAAAGRADRRAGPRAADGVPGAAARSRPAGHRGRVARTWSRTSAPPAAEVALMDAGKIVFHGTPDELTARGEGTGAAGDAPLERGYSAVLRAASGQATAARA